MKREIKFRAWFKGNPYIDVSTYGELESYNTPQMIYNVHKLYDGLNKKDDPNSILGGYSAFGCLLEDDSFIVEQFTGCLDKNGKEIYEGDILENEYYRVEIEDCTDLSIESEKEKVVVKFKVVWYEAGFILLDIDQNVLAEPMYSNFISRAQVIGNIHENK